MNGANKEGEKVKQTKKPKTLYPQRQIEIRIPKEMIILMVIMTFLLLYICFIVTMQSVYCISMAWGGRW